MTSKLQTSWMWMQFRNLVEIGTINPTHPSRQLSVWFEEGEQSVKLHHLIRLITSMLWAELERYETLERFSGTLCQKWKKQKKNPQLQEVPYLRSVALTWLDMTWLSSEKMKRRSLRWAQSYWNLWFLSCLSVLKTNIMADYKSQRSATWPQRLHLHREKDELTIVPVFSSWSTSTRQ